MQLHLVSRNGIQTSTRLSGKFEPDGIRYGPEIPEYDRINIRVRGYDFAVLESFYNYINKMAQLMSLETKW